MTCSGYLIDIILKTAGCKGIANASSGTGLSYRELEMTGVQEPHSLAMLPGVALAFYKCIFCLVRFFAEKTLPFMTVSFKLGFCLESCHPLQEKKEWNSIT